MAGEWDSAVKEAMKVLGDKGKIPKAPSSLGKARQEDDKSYKDFCKVREDLKKKVVEMQDSNDKWKNILSQYQDQRDEDDLGLDPRNKDDKKKITDARKILSDQLQTSIDNLLEDSNNFKELDKHLMNIAEYEPSEKS
jgi:hypothetical protein